MALRPNPQHLPGESTSPPAPTPVLHPSLHSLPLALQPFLAHSPPSPQNLSLLLPPKTLALPTLITSLKLFAATSHHPLAPSLSSLSLSAAALLSSSIHTTLLARTTSTTGLHNLSSTPSPSHALLANDALLTSFTSSTRALGVDLSSFAARAAPAQGAASAALCTAAAHVAAERDALRGARGRADAAAADVAARIDALGEAGRAYGAAVARERGAARAARAWRWAGAVAVAGAWAAQAEGEVREARAERDGFLAEKVRGRRGYGECLGEVERAGREVREVGRAVEVAEEEVREIERVCGVLGEVVVGVARLGVFFEDVAEIADRLGGAKILRLLEVLQRTRGNGGPGSGGGGRALMSDGWDVPLAVKRQLVPHCALWVASVDAFSCCAELMERL